MVLHFEGEQNTTIRTTVIQSNESRTSYSPYNTNFWLPCICGKKPCIIGKTKKTSLHLLSRDYNASQFLGMEVQCKILNVHRNYSFKATIFILMMLKTLHYLSKKKNVQNNVGSHLRRKLCAVKPTILSERHQVLSICLSRFSNTQSILLTSNFSPLCGTLVNFFDSYNLILSEYFLLTSP